MERKDIDNELAREEALGVRDSINREKGREVEPPRTVPEQVRELVSDEPDADDHRRRDPQKAAEAQKQRAKSHGS